MREITVVYAYEYEVKVKANTTEEALTLAEQDATDEERRGLAQPQEVRFLDENDEEIE